MINLERFPRIRLAFLPTPLQRLERLSAYLGGPEIWIKRDDCTGLAVGGNKTRKLEFVVADALAQGADTVVTVGGIQSNHTRQTAAAAAVAGLRCELVLRHWVDWNDPTYERVGNIFLSRLLGAHITIIPGNTRVGIAEPAFTEVMERVRSHGGRPYPIPAGASDHPLGGLGYVNCAQEILMQMQEQDVHIDAIVHASSSGSTQAGLVAGFHANDAALWVIGIDVDGEASELRATVLRIAHATEELLGVSHPLPDGLVDVRSGYAGPAYGQPTDETLAAIKLVAQLEGILLDPVYEGKGMAGLIDLVQRGEFKRTERVLFVHLGGSPALHAYAPLFQEKEQH
jgi:1-aminocyclopropane-1-carboxylate deaminase